MQNESCVFKCQNEAIEWLKLTKYVASENHPAFPFELRLLLPQQWQIYFYFHVLSINPLHFGRYFRKQDFISYRCNNLVAFLDLSIFRYKTRQNIEEEQHFFSMYQSSSNISQ